MTVKFTTLVHFWRAGAQPVRFSRPGLALLVALLAWPRPGWARDGAEPMSPANPEAQARYEAGVSAYEAGRYRDAIERFKDADELAPSPLLSFNIAKVYERMADDRNALAAYRTYLRRLPDADNRSTVAERIAALEHALRANGVQQLTVLSAPPGATVSIDNVNRGVTPWTGELIPGPHSLTLRLDGYRESVSEFELPAEHAIDIETTLAAGSDAEVTPPEPSDVAAVPSSAAAAPEPAPPAAEATPPMTTRWWTWAMLGGSAAAFMGAGAFELWRGSLEDEARKADVQVDYEQKFHAMENRQTVARVFVGVGVVAAIAGAVSLYLDYRPSDPEPATVAFDCAPRGCTLAAGGRF